MGNKLSTILQLGDLTKGYSSVLFPATALSVFMFGADYPIAAPAGGMLLGIIAMMQWVDQSVGNNNRADQAICGVAGAFAAVAGEFLAARVFGIAGGGMFTRILIAVSAGLAGYLGYENTAVNSGNVPSKGWMGYLETWQWWVVVLASALVIYGAF